MPQISQAPPQESGRAVAGRSVDEEDASSILESSLFFSCLSSAPPDDEGVGDGAPSEHDEGAHNAGKTEDPPLPAASVHREPSEPATGAAASGGLKEGPSPLQKQNQQPTPPAVDARASNGEAKQPAPLQSEQQPTAQSKIEARASNSSSNSSWSVIPEKERPTVRSITFNRDRTCLLLSTSAGVRIRTLESLSMQNLHDVDHNQQQSWIFDVPLPPDGATYAQLLHSSSLLAITKPSSPRCCFLYNAKSAASPLAALPLSAAVKRVELNRRCLAAMTVDLRLHVFHMTEGGGDVQNAENASKKKPLRPTLITTLNIMHPSDSPRNVTRGLDGYNAGSYFDFCPKEEEPILVCKSFNGTPGTVRVYDTSIVSTAANVASDASIRSGRSATSTASSWDQHNSPPGTKKIKRRIQLLTTINAHDNAVTRMLIGGGGKEKQTFLATVSSKGTTVRVFGLPSGEKLWEWHRGSKPCTFHSISWNGPAEKLATFGSSGTIHVFDWQKKKQKTGLSESGEGHEVDDGKDFQQVDDGALSRVDDRAPPATTSPKPLLRRLGSKIKRHATSNSTATPIKHRSMAKMKWKPSVLPTASPGSNAKAAKSQSLVLALLDQSQAEDRLVVCSMEGEVRQYSVNKNDKTIGLIQVEDVLARK